MNAYSPAIQPTLYFIGVTTTKSSIMKVFPAWAKHLGLDNAVVKGIDFPPHAPAQAYRDVVKFIKHDQLSVGALVTTHKIDLYKAAQDLFDVIDPHAKFMNETSCLSKRDGKLICHAKDPISSGLSLDGFLPSEHFAKTGAEVFSIGAGGSTIALTWHLMQQSRGVNRPSRIIVSNRSAARLNDIKRIHHEMNSIVPVDYVLAQDTADNDAVVAQLKPGSLVINATGLGKDAPGSPLTDAVSFPQNGIVWDLNYRGDLIFLKQARAHQQTKSLQIEDGWSYFIHGWTQVIAQVFNVSIPAKGQDFATISHIAIESAK
jgi:shikimate 5-dehydrogenase